VSLEIVFAAQAYNVRIIRPRTRILSADRMPDEGKKLIKEIFGVLRILSGNLASGGGSQPSRLR